MTRHRAAIIAVATVFSIDLFPFDRSPPMAHRSTGVFDDRPCRSWDRGPPMRGLRDSRSVASRGGCWHRKGVESDAGS